MTETEFRVKHSELIMYYQLIEMRLRGICAEILADKERGWFERLDDYSTDPIGVLLDKIKDIQSKKQITILEQDVFDALDALRETRNYWVHQCFGGAEPIIFKRGEVLRDVYAKQINLDLRQAVEWDEKLAACFRKYNQEKTTVN